jgi:hypothetical protein
MRLALLAFAGAMLAACDKPPVIWNDPVPIERPAGVVKLIVDTSGEARFVPQAIASATPPNRPGLCTSSIVFALGARDLHAAWWNVRPDSSAVLYVAASPDSGTTWGISVPVDTTDISSTGCRRPPPSLTTVGDDVYLAYSMIAPEGKGVFFAHSMSNMIHTPVPVIYGERLVNAAIAADEHRVAVAYEEPNGARPEVDVAVSASQGHLFEMHTTASRDIDAASEPAVAFAGATLAVAWTTRREGQAVARQAVRIGQLQPWN